MKVKPETAIWICLIGVVGGIIGLELNGVPDWIIDSVIGAGIIGAIIVTKDPTD